MGRRILKDALRAIVNAEKRGKSMVELKPISTVMSSFLNVMKSFKFSNKKCKHFTLHCQQLGRTTGLPNRLLGVGYIKDVQVYDPHRVGRITVDLQSRIKDCKALTYRQDIKANDIKEYTLRMLPTRQWGYVVITTPDGILDHEEATRRNVSSSLS